jgi:hypothetical protein
MTSTQKVTFVVPTRVGVDRGHARPRGCRAYRPHAGGGGAYWRKCTSWPWPNFLHRRLAHRPRTQLVPAGTVIIQFPHCWQRTSRGGAFSAGTGDGSRHDEATLSLTLQRVSSAAVIGVLAGVARVTLPVIVHRAPHERPLIPGRVFADEEPLERIRPMPHNPRYARFHLGDSSLTRREHVDGPIPQAVLIRESRRPRVYDQPDTTAHRNRSRKLPAFRRQRNGAGSQAAANGNQESTAPWYPGEEIGPTVWLEAQQCRSLQTVKGSARTAGCFPSGTG